MPIEVRMPRLVDTMTHGTVVAWRKQEGERVRAGDVIAEIEADKATVDLESPESGTLEQILIPAGSEHIEVGRVLALVDPSSPVKQPQADETAPAESRGSGRGNGYPVLSPAVIEKPVTATDLPEAAAGEAHLNASPLAVSIARRGAFWASEL